MAVPSEWQGETVDGRTAFVSYAHGLLVASVGDDLQAAIAVQHGRVPEGRPAGNVLFATQLDGCASDTLGRQAVLDRLSGVLQLVA
jgi:hypothetical protein